jgi:hypothetical protein
MRRCLIICAVLLASCGPKPRSVDCPRPYAPADLLIPAPGWQGPHPVLDGQLATAAAAEKRGREQANAQREALGQIVGLR